MADITGNNAAKGDLAKTGGAEIISVTSDATGFAKGEIVSFDANGLAQLADATHEIGQGFGVALETASANETEIRVAIGNTYIYVLAGDAIKPNFLVDVDATDGRAGQHGNTADVSSTVLFSDVNNVKDYFGRTVGRYIGHQLEELAPTDAADGDTIAIRLGL